MTDNVIWNAGFPPEYLSVADITGAKERPRPPIKKTGVTPILVGIAILGVYLWVRRTAR